MGGGYSFDSEGNRIHNSWLVNEDTESEEE